MTRSHTASNSPEEISMMDAYRQAKEDTEQQALDEYREDCAREDRDALSDDKDVAP